MKFSQLQTMEPHLQLLIIFFLFKNVDVYKCGNHFNQLIYSQNVLIQQDGCSKNQNITYLRLKKSTVPAEVFKNYTNVLSISLNHSELINIETGAFEGMVNLRELHLANNNIQEVGSEMLNTLPNLEILNLEYNNIARLEPGTFDSLLTLNSLILKRNKISKIHSGVFNMLTCLKILNLQNNHLNAISKHCFSNMSSLQTLDLGNNQLLFIAEYTFDGLPNLENLFIDRNLIYQIDHGTFKNLPKLLRLHVNNNLLSMLDCETFSNLQNLTYFRLEHNKLNLIPENCFQALNNLKGLFVNNNELAWLDAESLLGYHPKMEQVSLNSNLWKCNTLEGTVAKFMSRNVTITDGDTSDSENDVATVLNRHVPIDGDTNDYSNVNGIVCIETLKMKEIEGPTWVTVPPNSYCSTQAPTGMRIKSGLKENYGNADQHFSEIDNKGAD